MGTNMEKAMKSDSFDPAIELAVLDKFHRATRGQRVGVVYGPVSGEDRLYIERSPRQIGYTAIMESLDRLGYDSFKVDPTRSSFPDDLKTSDMLFLNIHGEFGEDGRLQGLLDYLGLRYTGSGVLSSAIGLNKVMFKRIIGAAGVLTPPYSKSLGIPVDLEINETVLSEMTFPLIAKPICGGSSIGTVLLRDLAAAESLFSDREAVERYGPFFVERFIEGVPLTVGVLELETCVVAAPPIEAKFDAEFYDEETKLDEHGEGLVKYSIRSMPATTEGALRRTALRIHRLIGCRGFSRVDFLLASDDKCYALEINTLPGMAYGSNFPAGTFALGLTYDQTILAMLRSCLWPKEN